MDNQERASALFFLSSLSLSFTISRAASPHGFIHSASPHRCPQIRCINL